MGRSPVGWFPDGTKLLAQATSFGAEHSSVWVISLLGGAAREIREGALAWSVAPDGLLIALTSTFFNSDIWLMGVNGEDPAKSPPRRRASPLIGWCGPRIAGVSPMRGPDARLAPRHATPTARFQTSPW